MLNIMTQMERISQLSYNGSDTQQECSLTWVITLMILMVEQNQNLIQKSLDQMIFTTTTNR